MQSLSGKTAVVTGGGNGIGFRLAHHLGREGMHVVLADLDPESLEDAAAALRGANVEVLAVQTDTSRQESVEALARAALDRFGRVHVVCSNAGVGAGGPVETAPLETWERVFGVNIYGNIHCLRAFIPPMKAMDEEAHFVFTASSGGLLASEPMFPFNAPQYIVSKYATVGLAECAYYQLLGTKIGVSCLCPSATNTRMGTRGGRDVAAIEAAARQNRSIEQVERNRALMAKGQDPDIVARKTVEAIKQRRFWVIPETNVLPAIRRRFQAIMGEGEMPAPREWIDD
ncbi:MAG: SDR family NAD(P)-dependent oxidoreductase [Caulobacteraceae bacterium]|nr:SDR family NAD(P)-dependent oxidoreductase [Caulobacteraceae bacterium]